MRCAYADAEASGSNDRPWPNEAERGRSGAFRLGSSSSIQGWFRAEAQGRARQARRPAAAADLDDGYDWLVDGGPPVVEGGSTALTCRTTDAEVASITSAVAPVRPVAAVRGLATPTPRAAPPAATLEALLRKYPPLSVKRVTSPEDDGWLAGE